MSTTFLNRRLVWSAAVAGVLAGVLALSVGCGPAVADREAVGSPPAGEIPTGQSGLGGAAGGGDGGTEPGEPGPGQTPGDPDPEPTSGGAPERETLVLTPVDLVAPLECFTEGLDERFVEGYGAQVVNPTVGTPGDLTAVVRPEYQGLTRIGMSATERRAHLLPGVGRPVAVEAGNWTVAVEVHVTLSGAFQIDYIREHRAETGAFRQMFTSANRTDPCTVEIIYAITTSTG